MGFQTVTFIIVTDCQKLSIGCTEASTEHLWNFLRKSPGYHFSWPLIGWRRAHCFQRWNRPWSEMRSSSGSFRTICLFVCFSYKCSTIQSAAGVDDEYERCPASRLSLSPSVGSTEAVAGSAKWLHGDRSSRRSSVASNTTTTNSSSSSSLSSAVTRRSVVNLT